MGSKWSQNEPNKPAFLIHVKTGDKRGAGTDANVYIVVEDSVGAKTPILPLDRFFHNDFERGHTDTFKILASKVKTELRDVSSIKIWRDKCGLGDAWFLEKIEVEVPEAVSGFGTLRRSLSRRSMVFRKARIRAAVKASRNRTTIFPFLRWISADEEYTLYPNDCWLPQDDPRQHYRAKELERKQGDYRVAFKVEGGPAQADVLPTDEQFSDKYFLDFIKLRIKLIARTKFQKWTSLSHFSSLDDLKKVFSHEGSLGHPKFMNHWSEDWWFGLQRIQGTTTCLIKLINSLPLNFGISYGELEPFLEGMSADEALERNKLFLTDLQILDGLNTMDGRKMWAPMALFYLNKDNSLMPIAIQLRQQKGSDNPVFLPSDPPLTWILAKMFYNCAEAQYHQACPHLGYTHLLMEGVCVATHRQLSLSHPVFKLLAPHFLFLLAINARGLEKLLSPGGWVDKGMILGVAGIFEVIKRGLSKWSLSVTGTLPNEIESRGMLDSKVIPNYPYRDDGILVYNAIFNYVTDFVSKYYPDDRSLRADWEIQAWRRELVMSKDQNGIGVNGVPGSDVFGLTSTEQLVEILTAIISSCSIGHSASNFLQYDEYAFIPNYPGTLVGEPPTSKTTLSESDLMKYLPHKEVVLDIMVITRLLSMRATNPLGHFEVQYMYDPPGVASVQKFQEELRKISDEIQKRNESRKIPYGVLDPAVLPNAISI